MTPRTLPGLRAPVVALVALLSAGGCANYADQLARSEQHYQNARYEAALVNLEDLEIHLGGLPRSERVRYDVVRGMTHLRLDQRADAIYWLAIAREEARLEPGVLSDSARATLERTLVELDPNLRPSASGDNPSAGGEADAGVAR